MPRYFIHLYNGEVLRDDVGQMFADDAQARAGGIAGASEIIAEHIAEGSLVDLRHRLEVEDEAREVVATIRFADLFTGYRGLVDQDDVRA